jgi:signal recognition particle GTPase
LPPHLLKIFNEKLEQLRIQADVKVAQLQRVCSDLNEQVLRLQHSKMQSEQQILARF